MFYTSALHLAVKLSEKEIVGILLEQDGIDTEVMDEIFNNFLIKFTFCIYGIFINSWKKPVDLAKSQGIIDLFNEEDS